MGRGEVQEVTWASLTWAPAVEVGVRVPLVTRGFLLGAGPEKEHGQGQAPTANSGWCFIGVTLAPGSGQLGSGRVDSLLVLVFGVP